MSEQQKMDQERAAFEAWYLREIEDGQDSLIKYPNGHYINDTTMDAWYGWQARASLPVGVPDELREARVVGFKPGMGEVTLYVGRLPTWLDMGHTCYVSAAPAAPTVKESLSVAPAVQAEHGNDGDNIQHLTDCDESGCERCENLMHFYQACEACGAWGHNDSGPCTCSQSSALSDTQRLNFMLSNCRKVVVESLPHDNFEVYVEEGFMGDKRYPGVRYSGDWEQGQPYALEIQREAIDAALLAQRERGGEA